MNNMKIINFVEAEQQNLICQFFYINHHSYIVNTVREFFNLKFEQNDNFNYRNLNYK